MPQTLKQRSLRMAAVLVPLLLAVLHAHGFIPWLTPEPHDVPLDAVLNDQRLLGRRRARTNGRPALRPLTKSTWTRH